MRKRIAFILDLLGIHSFVNRIRFYVPNLIKSIRIKKHGVDALSLLNAVFTENNSFFWLEFGTLLGAHRDNGFIKHDFDIDLGVLIHKKIPNLKEQLEMHGFEKSRELYIPEVGVIEETYVYKGVHIDIFYFYKDGGNIVCYSSIPDGDEHWSEVIDTKGMLMESFTFTDSGFGLQSFYDEKFYFPMDVDLHLRESYGNYKVRVRNWSDDKSPNRKKTNFRGLHSLRK